MGINIDDLLAEGVEQHQQGNLPRAEAIYRQVLAEAPDDADALHLLGLTCVALGRVDEGAEYLQKATEGAPELGEYWNSFGSALLALARVEEAAAAFGQALALEPEHVEAAINLASALLQRGDRAQAIARLQQAAQLHVNNAAAQLRFGALLEHAGEDELAHQAYERSVTLAPHEIEPRIQAAFLKKKGRDSAGALELLQSVLRDAPDNADAHYNIGVILREQGDLDGAAEHYQRAIEVAPHSGLAYNNLGVIHHMRARLGEALSCHQKAVELRPKDASPRTNLANDYWAIGLVEQGLKEHRAAIALDPSDWVAHSSLVQTLNYQPLMPPEAIFQEHLEWAKAHAEPFMREVRPHENNRDPARRPRVGFLSADLRNHPVGYFLEPLFAHLDRQAFEIFGYMAGIQHDEVTDQLKQFASRWQDVARATDDEIAEKIRHDRIDILVDVSGHTAQNRLLVLARKPAPIQITQFAYPNTTGMRTVDYRMSDSLAEPVGTTEHLSVERLVRLPKIAWCYKPLGETPPVGPLPLVENGFVTFGSLNNFAKMNTLVLETWAKIMKAVANSRLMLSVPDAAQERVRALFESNGVDADRLQLVGRVTRARYFQLHHEIDIYLDPFPYNGGVTSLDAMWMGVPVLSPAGQTYVSRQGLALLTNVGLTDWIAPGPARLVDWAARLAGDRERLIEIRRTLRQWLLDSPMMQHAAFAVDFGAALREMWRSYCAGGGS